MLIPKPLEFIVPCMLYSSLPELVLYLLIDLSGFN
mgnify:CR=1 FL=1